MRNHAVQQKVRTGKATIKMLFEVFQLRRNRGFYEGYTVHTSLFEHKNSNKTVNTVFFCTFTMKKRINI